jgi:hypothetical protein
VDIPYQLRQELEDAANHSLSTELNARGLLLDREVGALATAAAARSGVALLHRLIAHCYPDSRLPGRSTAVKFDGDEAAAHVEFALAFGAVTANLLAPTELVEPVDLLCAVFNLGIGLIDGLCDGDSQLGLPFLHIVQRMNLPGAAQEQWTDGQLRAALPTTLAADPTVAFTARVIESFFDLLHFAYPGKDGSTVRRHVGAQLEKALDAEGRSVDLAVAPASSDDLLELSRRTSVLPFQVIEQLAAGNQRLPQPTAGTLLGEAMWRIDDLVDLAQDAQAGALNSLLLAASKEPSGASIVAALEQLLASDAIPAAAARAAQCLDEGLALAGSRKGGEHDRRLFLSFVQRYARVSAGTP